MFVECEECDDKIMCALNKQDLENACRSFYDNYTKIDNFISKKIDGLKLNKDDYRVNSVWQDIEDRVSEFISGGRKPFVKVFFRADSPDDTTIVVYVKIGRITRTWQQTYVPDEEEQLDDEIY